MLCDVGQESINHLYVQKRKLTFRLSAGRWRVFAYGTGGTRPGTPFSFHALNQFCLDELGMMV